MKDQVLNYIESLSSREKNILVFFSFFALLFIVILFYFVMDSFIQDRIDDIKDREEMLVKIISYKNEYKRALEKKNSLKNRVKSNTTNINSYISGIKESLGVDIRTTKELKPEQKDDLMLERVDLSLSRIELSDLFSFLYALEQKNRYVFIDSIKIKRRYDKKNYNANIVVATIKEGGKE